jgi:hypothetical protein
MYIVTDQKGAHMAESTVRDENNEGTNNRDRGKPIKEREFSSDGMRLTAERLIVDVRDEFEQFLERASYLDLHLFYEVLNWHASICGHLDQDDATLAQAFMDAVGLSAPNREKEPEADPDAPKPPAANGKPEAESSTHPRQRRTLEPRKKAFR